MLPRGGVPAQGGKDVARGLFGSEGAATLLGMKVRASLTILTLLVAAAVTAPALLTSAAVRSADAAEELEEHMQALQAGSKGLEKALEKKELDKALGLVGEMQKAAHEAKEVKKPKPRKTRAEKHAEQAAALEAARRSPKKPATK